MSDAAQKTDARRTACATVAPDPSMSSAARVPLRAKVWSGSLPGDRDVQSERREASARCNDYGARMAVDTDGGFTGYSRVVPRCFPAKTWKGRFDGGPPTFQLPG